MVHSSFTAMAEFSSILPSISCLLLLLLIVFFFFALRVFCIVCWKPMAMDRQLKKQGIKGNPYRLLFGDARELMVSYKEALSRPMDLHHHIAPRALPYVNKIAEQFGNMSVIWIGMTPRVIVRDSELIKEVLANKSGQFQMLPLNPFLKLLAQGVSSVEGDKWVQHRSILNPAFQLTKLKGFIPEFCNCCGEMINKWEELAGSQGSCELDVWADLKAVAGDAISRTAFGSSYSEGRKVFEYQKEQIDLMMESIRYPYIPGFRFVPTQSNRRRYFIDKEIKVIIRSLIHKREQNMKAGNCHNEDLLGLLLLSNYDMQKGTESKFKGLTIDEIIEECKLFYFAGQDTTSVLLTWTMVLLSMHPIWQDRARKEVHQICGTSVPNFESINQFKILTMILHEVLRLYPPVTSQYRHVYSKTKLGELTLPAGTDLVLTTLLIHHDPEIWGDNAEDFNPERFANGVLKATNNQFAYFPFGWGPRTCIGQNFAMIEAKIGLAMILQHFAFELSPSYAHAPQSMITLQPQHGAQLILHRL